eukprot:scaffold20041_cov52-Phaeocystis_antarctica.AAC.3
MAPPHRSLSARLARASGASCDHLQPEYYDRVLSAVGSLRAQCPPGSTPEHRLATLHRRSESRATSHAFVAATPARAPSGVPLVRSTVKEEPASLPYHHRQ